MKLYSVDNQCCLREKEMLDRNPYLKSIWEECFLIVIVTVYIILFICNYHHHIDGTECYSCHLVCTNWYFMYMYRKTGLYSFMWLRGRFIHPDILTFVIAVITVKIHWIFWIESLVSISFMILFSFELPISSKQKFWVLSEFSHNTIVF